MFLFAGDGDDPCCWTFGTRGETLAALGAAGPLDTGDELAARVDDLLSPPGIGEPEGVPVEPEADPNDIGDGEVEAGEPDCCCRGAVVGNLVCSIFGGQLVFGNLVFGSVLFATPFFWQ